MLAGVPRPHTAVNGTTGLKGAPSAYSRAPNFLRVPGPQMYTLTTAFGNNCSTFTTGCMYDRPGAQSVLATIPGLWPHGRGYQSGDL